MILASPRKEAGGAGLDLTGHAGTSPAGVVSRPDLRLFRCRLEWNHVPFVAHLSDAIDPVKYLVDRELQALT
jgi:hypothetical protein